MSQFTSTMIDDESLIEELRRYGEPNLPTLPSSSQHHSTAIHNRRAGRSAATHHHQQNNELNDTNREIYLKKLNHYRAKEKAKTNPSKQFKKQQQAAAQIALADALNTRGSSRDANMNHDDDDEDVIEVAADAETTTSEYVEVNHASTSPMSNETTTHFDVYSHHDAKHTEPKLEYIKLKERIELDKTLSKYRSEIHNILATSNVRSRFHQPSSTLQQEEEIKIEPDEQDDVVYTKTVKRNGTSTAFSPNDVVTQVNYCPKPAPQKSSSFFRSITTAFNRRNSIEETENTSTTHRLLSRVRNGTLPEQTTKHDSRRRESGSTYLTPKKETNYRLTQHLSTLSVQIAKILPYLILIILTVIILQYVRMKFFYTQESVSSYENNKSPITTNEESAGQSYYDELSRAHYCEDVKDPSCSGTKLLAREMIDYLRSVSGRVDCSTTSTTTEIETDSALNRAFLDKCVHINRVLDYLTRERRLIPSLRIQVDAIDSVLRALLRNPHWDIRMLNSTYSDTTEINQVTYLMSTASYKPVTCRLRELAHFLYVRAVLLLCASLVLLVVYMAWTWVRNARAERERAFFRLVARVTEHVEKQHVESKSGSVKPYVAISHVYASIFEAHERGEKSVKLWDRVCKFIADHESRIHVEAQFIDGEETLVWKWVATTASNPIKPVENKSTGGIFSAGRKEKDDDTISISSTMTKSSTSSSTVSSVLGWQGDAFDRSERLLNSPTPCLKVRNMFDTNAIVLDPYFSVKIHNDILEKCSRVAASIFHIGVDKRSKEGCVYIKCATNEAAGKVYQTLNGTWYNGKLLTVKFLRMDRYLERFPNSSSLTSPVLPLSHP